MFATLSSEKEMLTTATEFNNGKKSKKTKIFSSLSLTCVKIEFYVL